MAGQKAEAVSSNVIIVLLKVMHLVMARVLDSWVITLGAAVCIAKKRYVKRNVANGSNCNLAHLCEGT